MYKAGKSWLFGCSLLVTSLAALGINTTANADTVSSGNVDNHVVTTSVAASSSPQNISSSPQSSENESTTEPSSAVKSPVDTQNVPASQVKTESNSPLSDTTVNNIVPAQPEQKVTSNQVNEATVPNAQTFVKSTEGQVQAQATFGYYDNDNQKLITTQTISGDLGTKLTVSDFKVPTGYSLVDPSWFNQDLELNTDNYLVKVTKETTHQSASRLANMNLMQLDANLATASLNNQVRTSVPAHSYGVDVSSFQTTNLDAYAANGAKFAIITNWSNGNGRGQVQSALANNMMVMAYHFARFSGNVQQAQAEARYAINQANAMGIPKGSYFACDYETNPSGNVQANTNAVLAFMKIIRENGYLPLFYSGAYFAQHNVDLNQIISNYKDSLWIAAYKHKGRIDVADMSYFPRISDGIAIWQFCDDWLGLNVDGDYTVLPLESLTNPSTVSVTWRMLDDNNNGQVIKAGVNKYNANSTFNYTDFGLPANYHWSNASNGTTGTSNINLDIHVAHNNSKVTDSKNINRTYEIDLPDGSKQTGTQTATFNRSGVRDDVTGNVIWGDWSAPITLKAIDIPKVNGYVASRDIPAITVSDQTQPINIIITYTKDSSTSPVDQDNQAIIAKAQSYHPINLVTKNVVNVANQGIIGDGKTDVTSQLQTVLTNIAKNGGGIVYLPKGNYMIKATSSDPSWTNPHSLLTPAKLEGLQVGSNTTILLDKDASLSVIPNNFWNYLVLNIQGADNVNILGGTLNGDRLSHDMSNPNWTWNNGKGFNSPYYGEWGNGLSIQSSNNTLVSGVKFKNFWGDGISLFPDKDQAEAGALSQAKNVHITGCTFDYNRRQGISVGHANNVEIDHSLFENTDGTGPAAGIDLEPGGGSTEQVTNVKIHDNVFLNNNNAGLTAYAAPKSKVSDVHVYNNTFINNGAWMPGQITFNNAENIEIDHNKFDNDDASRFHSIWMMNTANDNIHDNYGRNSSIRIAKEAHGEGKVTNNYVSSIMIENTGYDVANNHLPNEISSTDLATMGANWNYQNDVDYPGLATNEKVTFHDFNSRGKALNVTANPDNTVLNQSDPINWQADISFDIDGNLLTRKGDSDNTIRFAKPLFALVHTPDDGQVIGESDLLADTHGVPLIINGVNCGQVFMNYIVPNGNFKGSGIQHVELKNVSFGDGRIYKANQSGAKTLLTTADGNQYGYTYKNADGTLPDVKISDNQPEPKPSRPEVDELAQKLNSAAKSMLGYFDYDQVRPIKAALNGDDDSIKSLADVDKNGKVDCSGFVWLAMKLAGEKVASAAIGPWYTGSMAADATGNQVYLSQITDLTQLQPGDIIIVNKNDGSGNNGHTAVINGYAVDFGITKNSTASDILNSALPIIEMGGGKAHVNESTIKDAFLPALNGGTVVLARPVAMAPTTPVVPEHVTVTYQLTDTDDSNKVIGNGSLQLKPNQTYSSKDLTINLPVNYHISGVTEFKVGISDLDIQIPVAHNTENIPQSKTITRTIEITAPSGKQTKQTQTATFKWNDVKDLITGKVTLQVPTDTQTLNKVDVPVIDGYTASGDVPEIQVKASDQDSTVKITYTKNGSSDKPDQPSTDSVTVTYQFIDSDDHDKVLSSGTLNLKANQHYGSDQLSLVAPTNYHFSGTSEFDLGAKPMTIQIPVAHNTENIPQSKTVSRTIEITAPSGKQTKQTQTASFKWNDVKDLVTGKITSQVPTDTQTLNKVDIPVIDGYTASGDVPEIQVMASDQDSTVKITYTKNSSEPNSSSTPLNSNATSENPVSQPNSSSVPSSSSALPAISDASSAGSVSNSNFPSSQATNDNESLLSSGVASDTAQPATRDSAATEAINPSENALLVNNTGSQAKTDNEQMNQSSTIPSITNAEIVNTNGNSFSQPASNYQATTNNPSLPQTGDNSSKELIIGLAALALSIPLVGLDLKKQTN